MVEFVAKNTCGVIIVHAGEVSEQPARARTAVQLDTSAAAFVAERAREAEEEAAAAKSGKAKRARGKRTGKLGATFVQPQLPFGEAFGAEEKEAAHLPRLPRRLTMRCLRMEPFRARTPRRARRALTAKRPRSWWMSSLR